MQTKVVKYHRTGNDGKGIGEIDIELVVSEATVFIAMRRAVLQGSAENWVANHRAEIMPDQGDADGKDEDGAQVNDQVNTAALLDLMAGSLTARILYPDLLACVVKSDGLDTDALTVDTFMELPDRLTSVWEAAVYELNPHWLPGGLSADAEDEAAEKKG